MSADQLVETLSEIGFLRGIDRRYLERIAEISRLVTFPEGVVIFREGAPAAKLYLIARGSVSLDVSMSGGGPKRIVTVGEGELLGWSPVLEQTRLTATARTLSATEAVETSGGQILTLCAHNPQFGYEFMRRAALTLAQRLTATRLQLLDVYGTELPAPSQQSRAGGD